MTFESIRLQIAELLNITYVDTVFFTFNNWSIVHILGAFLFGFFATKIKKMWFLYFVIVWEMFEMFASANTKYFLLEPISDMLWDIVFTFGFFVLGKKLKKKQKV